MSGRVILHYILVCRDILRHYNRKKKPPKCTIKVDLRKAYDSISWDDILNFSGFVKGSFPFLILGDPSKY